MHRMYIHLINSETSLFSMESDKIFVSTDRDVNPPAAMDIGKIPLYSCEFVVNMNGPECF